MNLNSSKQSDSAQSGGEMSLEGENLNISPNSTSGVSPHASTSPLISVVIPSWNGLKLLKACLPSIARQTYMPFEAIIVDNGSSDGTADFVVRHFPDFRLIRLPENMGFAAAANHGIKAAKGEYIAFLNNDAEAHEKWLEELYKAVSAKEKTGFASSKMLKYRDRKIIDGAGDGYTRFGLAFRRGRSMADNGQYEIEQEVFSACAAAAIFKREVFNSVGLFDEDFFCYLEDVDLCFRARWAGFRGTYAPESVVYHIGGATTGGDFNKKKIYYDVKNTLNIMVKNMPAGHIARHFSLIFIYLLKMFSHYSVLERAPWSCLRGALAFIGQLRPMLAKRRAILSSRVVSDPQIFSIMKLSEAERRREGKYF